MASLDLEHLGRLLIRFKGFKKPNDTQKLIMLLGEKTSRNSEDDKKLIVLLKAEKKADQLILARKAANDVINFEKNQKRKLETRQKIIWGSALLAMAKSDTGMAQTLIKLYESGYISDSDKQVIRLEYEVVNKRIADINK